MVTVIIVNYNGGHHLATCLQSLRQHHSSATAEVIIVDNASSDGSVDHLPPGTVDRLIRNGQNVGFGRACNQAAQEARGEALFFVNPDVIFTEPLIGPLADYLREHGDVAAVGPRLVYPDGRLQPSRGSFPTVLRSAALVWEVKRLLPDDEAMIRWGILSPWFAQHRPVEAEQVVDYLTGACLMVRRRAFDAVQGFDEGFFLYYEEIDLCRRLAERGGKTVFLGSLTARHVVAAAAGQAPYRRLGDRRRSLVHYANRHFRTDQRWLLALVLGCELVYVWITTSRTNEDRRGYLYALGEALRGVSLFGGAGQVGPGVKNSS